MNRIFSKIFGAKKDDSESAFKAKFAHFQALLASNDEAHKSMSELIELIASGKPFAKSESDRLFRNLTTNTEEMVRHLIDMTQGKHQMLLVKVNEIAGKCLQILSEKISCPESWDCRNFECHICNKAEIRNENIPYSYLLSEIDDSYYLEVGSKMSRLAEIRNHLDIPVPNGFCLTARLFEDILLEENIKEWVNKILDSIDYDDLEQIQKAARDIQDIFIGFNIPEYIKGTILDAYDRSFPHHSEVRLSVRSSALGEDSEKYSFAGLHHSELNVTRNNLIDACWEVLTSKYSPQSIVYRYISGLRDEDMPMSVGCIEMINSEAAGILFTKDPNGLKEGMIIQAVKGLGSMAVEGQVTPQEFIISHTPDCDLLDFTPGDQKFKEVLKTTGGVVREAVSTDERFKPFLSDDQIKQLGEYALSIEERFGSPQDIEWAVDQSGKIYILQARPLKIKKKSQNKVIKTKPVKEYDSNYEILIDEGDCASSGIGAGPVFCVNSVRDLMNFPTGSVIVARKNLPEFASIIHKVSAVITESGSTTGHLSIIARELNIPILTNIGVNISKLAPGMEVTVYPDEKRVYKGKVDELIDTYHEDNEEEMFRNSPLYRIWHSITKFIFKLNLTDPNSPQFSPEYCKTLHDIIRFTHETAMKSMFSLYENARVDSGKAYYLKFDVPLEIYIIDLGNGLKYKPERKWVTPDEVASPLFQALARGMTTPGIRWSGHLVMDTKGYASIIFGNIVDVHRGDSSLGATSYILLSDKYLNFFSRLGYHFSRLDAFASDEINKNYVNFNLRGGAADPIRRARRVRVIGRILEHLNFSVTKTDDNVIGTIRKIPEETVYYLLSELGRLMGAVRNTDVTMVSEEYMDEFVKAFLEGDPAPALKLSTMWK